MKSVWVMLIGFSVLLVALVMYGLSLFGFEIPSILPEDGLVPLVSALSAIGSAIAAAFSFSAARSANSLAVKSFNEQARFSHRELFEASLDKLEQRLPIVFRRRSLLYQNMFPDNWSDECEFCSIGALSEFELWRKEYNVLTEIHRLRDVGEEEIFNWIFTATDLLQGNLKANVVCGPGERLYYQDYETVASSESPSVVNDCIVEVINELALFAKVEQPAISFRMSDAFVELYENTYRSGREGNGQYFLK